MENFRTKEYSKDFVDTVRGKDTRSLTSKNMSKVEKAVNPHRESFKDKTILLINDDPKTSAIWLYFSQLATIIGYSKLVSIYKKDGKYYRIALVPSLVEDNSRVMDFAINQEIKSEDGKPDSQYIENIINLDFDYVMTNPRGQGKTKAIDVAKNSGKPYIILDKEVESNFI